MALGDTLVGLCDWYERQCHDDWHEDRGIKIETLDNPGWSLRIDLKGTPLEQKVLDEVKIERSEHDWLVARRDASIFEAFGGPRNLDEMVRTFLVWAS